jgi:hypothetical protein
VLTHGAGYETITRRAVENQEATARTLSDITGELGALSTRMSKLERILEAAE